jgi:esterase/lipase superfamily enzyme
MVRIFIYLLIVWVIESMMLEVNRQKRDNVTALYKEVILAGSDVDWQVFKDPRHFIITVYNNTKDLALVISETTKNAFNKLGKFGFRARNKTPSHVYNVDCTRLKDQQGFESEIVQHWYYKRSPKAVAHIIEVLKGRKVKYLFPTSELRYKEMGSNMESNFRDIYLPSLT